MPYNNNFRRGGSRGGFGGRSRGFGGGGFRREMHKITCSECGKEAEVPFKPREGLPVYCRECFFKKKGITPRSDRKEESESEESEEDEESEEEPEEDKY